MLIQLGIYEVVQQTGAGIGRLRLFNEAGDQENSVDIRIELDQIPLGRFCDFLPEFIAISGFRWVAPFKTVLTKELHALMTAMMNANIFELNEQLEFVLTEAFAASLFERSRTG